MRAVVKPLLAFVGLVALSTALSADSRRTAYGGGAGATTPGFLYSEHLQTTADEGRAVAFQGSFVVENHRPFAAEIGGEFPKRLFGEIDSLPLREWGLGYAIDKRRPAHQEALLGAGWRVADWLAEETLMAATENSRGRGLIRTLEFDLQSELGNRRAAFGLNALGAFRETSKDAIAWQLRGFKSSGGAGGNVGLIYRWATADDNALLGINSFVDYESYETEDFWRWSAGGEVRTAWADVFGNYYKGFEDEIRKDGEWLYSAEGYDVELNVHSPDLPWLVGEITYFHWKGIRGDDDDKGLRFGLRVNPATGLQLGVEYEKQDDDNNSSDTRDWAGWVKYAGRFGESAQRRARITRGEFKPSDYFFTPVQREYSQRIRKTSGPPTDTQHPRVRNLRLAALPISLFSEAASVALTIQRPAEPFPAAGQVATLTVQGTNQGAAVDVSRTYTVLAGNVISGFILPTDSTVTMHHANGQTLTLYFPRTETSVVVKSTLAMASENEDFFRLIHGSAEITLGTVSGNFVAEQFIDASNMRRFELETGAATMMLTLEVTPPPAGTPVNKDTHLPVPTIPLGAKVEQVVGGEAVTLTLTHPRANIVLANDPVFVTGAATPIYYREDGRNPPFVVATLQATDGVGDYQWTKSGGELGLVGNVVEIPSGATAPTDAGVDLTVQVVLTDGYEDGTPATDPALVSIASQTDNYTVGFTVSYRRIAELAANFDSATRVLYGISDESPERIAVTVTAVGGPGDFSYAKTGGELNVRSAGGNGGFGHVIIPAGTFPRGNVLELTAELSQPSPRGTEINTVAFTVSVEYIGIPRVGANLTPDAPAVSVSPNVYAITAEAGDTGRMDVLVVAGSGGAGGNFTMQRTDGDLSFNPTSGQVYISSGTTPRTLPYSVVIEIDDSGTGSEATPTYTLTVQVQYREVGVINVRFNDPDGLVTVFGLQGDADGQQNVAQVVADGGFGGVTVAKVGGQLELSGNTNGAQINIPADAAITPQPAPNGRELLLMVSANDGNDDEGITDAKTATMTVRYVQVNQLGGAYYPADSNGNGEVPSGASRITAPVHTVGMAAPTGQFTVASLSVSGGVGDYQYRQIGGGNLSVDGSGQVLMAANVVPSPPGPNTPTYVIVVAVNDRGTNDNLTPEITLTLTVSYNTIVPIGADVVDIRNNDAVIKPDGGTVYFLSAGNNVATKFGRLNIRGGFGGEYEVVLSNQSGITYDQTSRELSIVKCSSGTQSITFTIDDKGPGSDLTTESEVLSFSVTNECRAHVSANVKDLSGTAVAGTLLRYGLEAVNAPSDVAVATIEVSGGAGDLTAAKTSGELNLDGVLSGGLLTVEIPAGTTPKAAGNANNLVLVAVVNDANANGGFLTNPATVSVTANYVAVPSVVLNLNRSGNPIDSAVDVYGKEGVPKTEKIADIMTGGGAEGANVAAVLHSSATQNAFAISGNDLNLSRTFPSFADGAENVIAAVVANDSGGTQAHTDATPEVVKRATVRLLPVLGTVEAGGDIAVETLNNIVQPDATSKTQTDITVYVRRFGGVKESRVIARINPASVENNATVSGVSGLQLIDIDANSGTTGAGLEFDVESGNVAAVKIAATAAATPTGADLNIVMTYNDRGHAIASLTDSRTKTLNVHYESVPEFIPQFRNVDDSAIPNNADAVSVYVAEKSNQPVRVARLNKVGGAAGNMRIVSQSGDLDVANEGGIFYAFVRANADADTTLVLTVRVDDANTPQGAVTDPVELELTVAYLISRDVIANFEPTTGDGYFVGALNAGLRTVYLDAAVSPREAVNVFRLNAASGSGTYVYTEQGVAGFNFVGSGNNDRMLALQPSVADGAKAYATVKVDDSGGGADQTEPATAALTVEVKLVTAIAAEIIPLVGEDTATDGRTVIVESTLVPPARGAINIANVAAENNGLGGFVYTKQSGAAELSVTPDGGEIMLAAGYAPNGNNTLMIVVAVNDTGDGSTLTPEVAVTLQYVLAETIGANVFLRSNNGAYLPDEATSDVAVGSETRTVKVKTADYRDEQFLFGVSGSGGLGNSGYAIARATGGNENGLVARGQSQDQLTYDLEVVVKNGADVSTAPNTFGITAVVNESAADPNNLTPGATISLTVVYDKVDPLAGEFQQTDTDGTPIVGRHVVVKRDGADTENNHVANIVASGGVGGESGNSYTFTQDNPGSLIVNAQGQVLVAANVVPAEDLELAATVKINDRGDWEHVSDELLMSVTVLYSAEFRIAAVITDTNGGGTISPDGGTVYFRKTGADANQGFGRLSFSGGVSGDALANYEVATSNASGLAYNAANGILSMTKCTDSPSVEKSIRLTINDKDDTDGLSDPLILNVRVHSGAEECLDPISAGARDLSGGAISAPVKVYALAGALTEPLAVATISASGGGGTLSFRKTGGGLALTGNLSEGLTVLIPSGTSPAAGTNGTRMDVAVEIDDELAKGGFLFAAQNVEMTADYVLIQGHSNLTVLRDGETTAEDLDGSTTYPLIRDAQSSTPVAALSEVGFKTPLSGEALSRVDGDAALLFDAGAKEVQVAANTPPDGRTLTLKLRGSDGEGNPRARVRIDRLYTVAVRYLKELTAKAVVAENGADITGIPEIKVPTGETGRQVVGYVEIDGGTEGYVLNVVGSGSVFELDGRTLAIKAGTTPGALADGGTLLTATVRVNDDDSEVGGSATPAVDVVAVFKYIALPPVEGSFVDGRNVTQAVSDSQPVTVYSKYSLDPAPLTLAAVAKGTVGTRTNDNFTFRKIGGGILLLDEDSGEITVPSRRPQSGERDTHIITVEFSALTNAVASRETLTVVHQMVRPIISFPNGFQSQASCGTPQVNSNANNPAGSLITVILPTREEGTEYSRPSGCNFFAFGQDRRIHIDQPQLGYNLGFARSVPIADGLEVFVNRTNNPSEHAVRLAGNPPTYTAGTLTLSIVIAYDGRGPAAHVIDTFLRTVYVVFPGVRPITATLKDAGGNVVSGEVRVEQLNAARVVVARVEASGGADGGLTYEGEAINGSPALEVNANNGEIAVPASIEPVTGDGKTITFAVSVVDSGTHHETTPNPRFTLTLVYVKPDIPPLAGTFSAAARSAGSRLVLPSGDDGTALNLERRLTVYGTSADSASDDLALFDVSFATDATGANVEASGNDFVVRAEGGKTVVFLKKEHRKRWGTEFNGAVVAADSAPETGPNQQRVRILLVERLSGVAFGKVDSADNNKAAYFYDSQNPGAADMRPVAELKLTPPIDGLELEAKSGEGFVWDSASGELRRGAVLTESPSGTPPADTAHTLTLKDPGANPKILPVELKLTVRYERLVPVSFGTAATVRSLTHNEPGDVAGVFSFTPQGGLIGKTFAPFGELTRSEESFGLTVQGTPDADAEVVLNVDGTYANLAAGRRASVVFTYSSGIPGVADSKITANVLYTPTPVGAGSFAVEEGDVAKFEDANNSNPYKLLTLHTDLGDGTTPLFDLTSESGGVDLNTARPVLREITNTGFVITEATDALAWKVAIRSGLTAEGQTLTLIVELDDSDAVFGKFTPATRATLRVKYGEEPPRRELNASFFHPTTFRDLTEITFVERLGERISNTAMDVARAGGSDPDNPTRRANVERVGPLNVALRFKSSNSDIIEIGPSQRADNRRERITVRFTIPGSDFDETLRTLTVHFIGVGALTIADDGFKSNPVCHTSSLADADRITGGGTRITLTMPAREQGFEFTNQGHDNTGTGCDWFLEMPFSAIGGGAPGGVGNASTIAVRSSNGLQMETIDNNGNKTLRVQIANAPHTYTAGTTRRDMVLAIDDTGTNRHFSSQLLATVFVEFPGVPSVAATVRNLDMDNTEDIVAPITAYAENAGAQDIALVVGGGGAGGGFSYSGEAVAGAALAVNSSTGIVFIPANLEPVPGDGLTVTFAVNVADRGANSAATGDGQARLTVVYIKGIPPLAVEARSIADEDEDYNAASTLYALAGNLTQAVAVAQILPTSGSGSGYEFSLVGNAPGWTLRTEGGRGKLFLAAGRNVAAGAQPVAVSATVRTQDGGENVDVKVVAQLRGLTPVVFKHSSRTSDPRLRVQINCQYDQNEDADRRGIAYDKNDNLATSNTNRRFLRFVLEEGLEGEVWQPPTSTTCSNYANIGAFAVSYSGGNGRYLGNLGSWNNGALPPPTYGHVDYAGRDYIIGTARDGTDADDAFTARFINGFQYNFGYNEDANAVIRYQAGPRTLTVVADFDDFGPGSEVTPPDHITVEFVVPGVPRMRVNVQNASGGAAGGGAIFVIQRLPERLLAGRINAQGGAGGGFTYVKTGGELEVDDTGRFYIPANISSIPSPGRELVVTVRVNDRNGIVNGRAASAFRTPEQVISVTVRYIQPVLKPLSGEVRNLGGNAAANGAAGTFYRVRDSALPAPRLVATVIGKEGTQIYSYAIVGSSDGLTLESGCDNLRADDRGCAVHIPTGAVAGAAGNELAVTVRITDNGGATFDVTAKAIFERVEPHALQGTNPASNASLNLAQKVVVVRDGAQSAAVAAVNAITIAPPGTMARTDSNAQLIFNVNNRNLQIAPSIVPNAQTLAAVFSATDGEDTPQQEARPDASLTLQVRYVDEIAAALVNRGGSPIHVGVQSVTVFGAGSVFVASVQAEGGVGAYTYAGSQVAGATLHLDADGVVFIPATLSPTTGDGLTLTFAIDTNDSGDDSAPTDSVRLLITVKYVREEARDLELAVQNTDATPLTSAPQLYRLAGLATDALIDVALLVPDGGVGNYTYRHEGAPNGLVVNLNKVQIPVGAVARSGEIKVTAVVESNENAIGYTLSVTVTARFNPVNPHLLDPSPVPNRADGKFLLFTGLETLLTSEASAEDVVLANPFASTGATLSLVEPGSGLDFVNNQLVIVGGTEPLAQTLSLQVLATDGEGDAQKRARTDASLTVQIRYIPTIKAGLSRADALVVAPITITNNGGASLAVATVSVGGGVGGYVFAASAATGTSLHLDSNGVLYIPASLQPPSHTAPLTITMSLSADDSGANADVAPAASFELTLVYNRPSGPIQLRLLDRDGANPASGVIDLWRQTNLRVAAGEVYPAAVVEATGGFGNFRYEVVGTRPRALDVRGRFVVMAEGEVISGIEAGLNNRTREITVRVTDNNGATADVNLTVRFRRADSISAPNIDITPNDQNACGNRFDINGNSIGNNADPPTYIRFVLPHQTAGTVFDHPSSPTACSHFGELTSAGSRYTGGTGNVSPVADGSFGSNPPFRTFQNSDFTTANYGQKILRTAAGSENAPLFGGFFFSNTRFRIVLRPQGQLYASGAFANPGNPAPQPRPGEYTYTEATVTLGVTLEFDDTDTDDGAYASVPHRKTILVVFPGVAPITTEFRPVNPQTNAPTGDWREVAANDNAEGGRVNTLLLTVQQSQTDSQFPPILGAFRGRGGAGGDFAFRLNSGGGGVNIPAATGSMRRFELAQGASPGIIRAIIEVNDSKASGDPNDARARGTPRRLIYVEVNYQEADNRRLFVAPTGSLAAGSDSCDTSIDLTGNLADIVANSPIINSSASDCTP